MCAVNATWPLRIGHMFENGECVHFFLCSGLNLAVDTVESPGNSASRYFCAQFTQHIGSSRLGQSSYGWAPAQWEQDQKFSGHIFARCPKSRHW